MLIFEGHARVQGDNFSLTSGLKNFQEPVRLTSVVVIDIGSLEIS